MLQVLPSEVNWMKARRRTGLPLPFTYFEGFEDHFLKLIALKMSVYFQRNR